MDEHPRNNDDKIDPIKWKSGIAAWLGWMFDGLEMHLYTLVAAPFVAQLLNADSFSDERVKRYSAWIQAAFLFGWAIGGGIFGRIGDLLGRSKTLALSILFYAVFTGLSTAAQAWWHLLILRFLAALGIGGEWAIGASLLAETWPKRLRPWIAAVLQTGVNIGILIACVVVFLMAGLQPRWVFLVGVVPACIVAWIRRNVPEPEVWTNAKTQAERSGTRPKVLDLFVGDVRKATIGAVLICSLALTAWWAFLFWYPQHLRNLQEISTWPHEQRERFVSLVFFLVIAVSIGGNFFAGFLARLLGWRAAISLLFFAMFISGWITFYSPRNHTMLLFLLPVIGFFSGVFGLFTMFLPPLFPPLLRTTGAGFCFNIGRITAAFGTIIFGLFSQVGDFRKALLLANFLFLFAAIFITFFQFSPWDQQNKKT